MAILFLEPRYRLKTFILFLMILLISSFILEYFFQDNESDFTEFNTEVINTAAAQNLLSNMPLRFITNKGQAGAEAKYHVQGAGHTVLFHESKVVFRRAESEDTKNEIVLEFEGASQNTVVEGVEKLTGVAHFYNGNDPNKWQTNVPTYGSVMYKELYPGIDMAYIGNEGKLESEFYVSPGADYNQIKLNYRGIKSKRIRDDGALIIETELGELVEKTPIAYQEIDGSRSGVEVQYVLMDNESIGFELGNYNHDMPLVIDPELIFITTIEPTSSLPFIYDVVIDGDGNLVLAGEGTRAFPVTDTIQGSNHLTAFDKHGLLLKLDGQSGEIIYSALFGGDGSDHFEGIALDSEGNIYLTGKTSSTNFPVMNAAQNTLGGLDDAFVVILSAAVELTYSTYLGGSDVDWSIGIALDGMGNIFIGGFTHSTDFPTVNGFQQQYNGGRDDFVAKFNSSGSVIYATYLGGSDFEDFGGIAVNSSGQATILSNTASIDFPMENAYQNTYGGGVWDLAITKLNSTGNGLIYSTYFGGAVSEWATDIELGTDGDVYVTGGSTSLDFPVINGESFPEADSSDGIIIRLDNTGQPVYSLRTNLPGDDWLSAVAVDDSNKVFPVSTYRDTLRIYEIVEDNAFESSFNIAAQGFSPQAINRGGMAIDNIFTFGAPGLSITDIWLTDGKLAIIGTTWDPYSNREETVGLFNLSVVSGINESDTKQPISFSLSQNYPNPFNPITIIKYQIPELSLITLKVYDVLGSEIATLVNEEKPIGNYTVEFDATELSSGIYFYRIQAGSPSAGSGQSFVETKKMVLLR